MRLCYHCDGDIDIRNPKGFCDHLYYPDNCKTCQENNKVPFRIKQNRQYLIAKFWKEFESRCFDDAMKVLLIIEQYDEVLGDE